MTAFGMGSYVHFIGPGPFGEGSGDYQRLLCSLSGSFLRHGGESTLPVSPGARCLDLVREVRVRLLPSVPGAVHVHRPGTLLQVPRPMSDLVCLPGGTQASPAVARGRPQLRAVRIDNACSLLCTALTFFIPSARHRERLHSEGESSPTKGRSASHFAPGVVRAEIQREIGQIRQETSRPSRHRPGGLEGVGPSRSGQGGLRRGLASLLSVTGKNPGGIR